MESNWATLAGHVHTTFDLEALAIQLATSGLQVEIATRVGATPVDYIHIHEGDDFTVQQVSPDHYGPFGKKSPIDYLNNSATQHRKNIPRKRLGRRAIDCNFRRASLCNSPLFFAWWLASS